MSYGKGPNDSWTMRYWDKPQKGLGFGSLATLFHMMNVLAASLGPGSPGLEINGISNGNQNLYFTRFVKSMTHKHESYP